MADRLMELIEKVKDEKSFNQYVGRQLTWEERRGRNDR
jgi:hypothetical protein